MHAACRDEYAVPHPTARCALPQDPLLTVSLITRALAVIAATHARGLSLGPFDWRDVLSGLDDLARAAQPGDALDELEDIQSTRHALLDLEATLREGSPDLLREVVADAIIHATHDFETAEELRLRIFESVRLGLERALTRLRRAIGAGRPPDLRLDVRACGPDAFAVNAYRNRLLRSRSERNIEIRSRLGELVSQRERVSGALLTLDDLAYDRPRRERPTPRILIERPTTNAPRAIPPVDED